MWVTAKSDNYRLRTHSRIDMRSETEIRRGKWFSTSLLQSKMCCQCIFTDPLCIERMQGNRKPNTLWRLLLWDSRKVSNCRRHKQSYRLWQEIQGGCQTETSGRVYTLQSATCHCRGSMHYVRSASSSRSLIGRVGHERSGVQKWSVFHFGRSIVISHIIFIKSVQSQIIFTASGRSHRRQYLSRKYMKSKLPAISYPNMKLRGGFDLEKLR